MSFTVYKHKLSIFLGYASGSWCQDRLAEQPGPWGVTQYELGKNGIGLNYDLKAGYNVNCKISD